MIDATQRAYERVKAALLDVPVEDATQPQIADAILAVGLDIGLSATDERTMARVLMGMAEKYLARAKSGAAQPKVEEDTAEDSATLLQPIEAAAKVMMTAGHPPALAATTMLTYAARWLATIEGRLATAGRLYRAADGLAGPETRH